MSSTKNLKFSAELVPLVLSGSKTSTWRLFDDKDLQVGDVLELVKRPELVVFARAKITSISEKPLRDLKSEDFDGHEPVGTPEEMYARYNDYYKDAGKIVGQNTLVKIIRFVLVS